MSKSKKEKSFANVLFLLKLIVKFVPSYFILTILFSFVQIFTPLNDTLIPKTIVDSLSNNKELSYIFVFVIVGAIIRISTAIIFPVFFDYIIPKYETILKAKINQLLMIKSSKYDLMLFEKSEFYDKYSRALKEADVRASGIVSSFGGLLTSMCYLSTLFAIIVSIDPVLIFACLMISISSSLGNKKKSKTKYDFNKNATKPKRFYDYLKRIFYEPQYAKEVRFYSLPDFLSQKFTENINEIETLIMKRAKKILPIDISIGVLRQGILYSFVIAYIVIRIYHGYLSVGDFIALFTAAIQLSSQLNSIGSHINSFFEHGLFAKDLRTILNYIPNIESDEKNNEAMYINQNEYFIEINNVSFAYDSQELYKDLSLKINTNEKIAIVGRNGAGKTTLIKLLLRLYDPICGNITLNGVDYKSIPVKEIRRKIGIVFQDMQFFSVSIAENILLRPFTGNETDKNIVCSALEKVGLLSKVSSLPNGINTILYKEFDDEGIVFSGGELQKLALARVFASDCDIIILDEPSSALDPISEKEMFDFMCSATINKTMILITHRLSSVKMVDMIYLMDNGEIVENGTHEELIGMHGKYYEMFCMQAENYINMDKSKQIKEAETPIGLI